MINGNSEQRSVTNANLATRVPLQKFLEPDPIRIDNLHFLTSHDLLANHAREANASHDSNNIFEINWYKVVFKWQNFTVKLIIMNYLECSENNLTQKFENTNNYYNKKNELNKSQMIIFLLKLQKKTHSISSTVFVVHGIKKRTENEAAYQRDSERISRFPDGWFSGKVHALLHDVFGGARIVRKTALVVPSSIEKEAWGRQNTCPALESRWHQHLSPTN